MLQCLGGANPELEPGAVLSLNPHQLRLRSRLGRMGASGQKACGQPRQHAKQPQPLRGFSGHAPHPSASATLLRTSAARHPLEGGSMPWCPLGSAGLVPPCAPKWRTRRSCQAPSKPIGRTTSVSCPEVKKKTLRNASPQGQEYELPRGAPTCSRSEGSPCRPHAGPHPG
jgi:hypothetical protein